MQLVLLLAAVTAVAMARPETYKEKEDFQYSRSSSDEGTKSGFYGAQRGNMGGNYERAHNMDVLAQHQMGGLVRNVEGELGDGAKQKSGSVFAAANSRGVYGSGHYDLSNLEGRNFQETSSFADSQSHSSLSTQNAGYGSQYSGSNSGYGSRHQNSRYSGYHTNHNTDQALYTTNMQSADNLQSANQYDASQGAVDSGYSSHSGYHGQSTYDQAAANSHLSTAYGSNNAYGSNVRLVSATPVRVYVRPGTRVTVPVAAQTYDSAHGSALSLDQNALNSETEALGSQQTFNKPTNNAKQYETSYSYRKEWEKHSEQPVTVVAYTVPTVHDYPTNSELYEDNQAHTSGIQHEASAQGAQNVHSNRHYSGYNVKSGSSSQSKHQAAGYNAASDLSSSSNIADSSAYTHGAYNHGASASSNTASLNGNQVEDFRSKPKSYQSSYSYHKSWERQGDPYVIKPASNGLYIAADTQASQKLTASSNQGTSAYGAHQYGTHYHQGPNGVDCDCDENGHIRVARSYNLGQEPVPYQQSQNIYEGQDFGQQSQNLEDFGQQSQKLEDFGQQSQKLEDFGQQSQKLEDFGQQSQNLENFGQQSQNLEDFGQQPQNLGDLGQQSQNLEDFGQQTQDVGQETQSQWSNLQQSQNQFDRIEDLGQQTQNQWDQQSQTDPGQETQDTWSALETTHLEEGSKDIEQKLNEMDTGFDQHHFFQSQESTSQTNPLNTHFTSSSQTSQVYNIDNPLQNVVFNQQTEAKFEKDLTDFTQNFLNNYHQPVISPLTPWDIPRVHQERPDGTYLNEHNLHTDTGYGHNQHNYFSQNTGHSYNYIPYGYRNTHYEHAHTNPFQMTGQDSYINPYENSQSHHNYNGQSSYSVSNINYNSHESNSTSLTNLWNLIDNIEKETTASDDSDTFKINTSYLDRENAQTNNNFNFSQDSNQHNKNTEINSSLSSLFPMVTSNTTDSPQTESTTSKKNNVHAVELERGDIEPETTLKPEEDEGRGDIGPDDSSNVFSNSPKKPLEIYESNSVNLKPYKTSEEIETLSLTKETNETTLVNAHKADSQDIQHDENGLSVLSLADQKQVRHHNEQDNWKLQSDIQITTTTTPKVNYLNRASEEKNKPNTENSIQQMDNTNQESYKEFPDFDQHSVSNIEQTVDFSEQSKHLGQEAIENQFPSYIQQSYLHGINIESIPDETKQNVEQQFKNLDQQSLSQQEVNNFSELAQQNENLGQEQQSFDQFEQANQGFNQENIEDFGQHQYDQESMLDRQNGHELQGQQLENWGQQDEHWEELSQVEDNADVKPSWSPNENIQQQNQQVETFVPPQTYPKEGRETPISEPIVEQELVTKKTLNVDLPPEPVTEKVGFWNKVGSKLSNAKEKVASWFSGS